MLVCMMDGRLCVLTVCSQLAVCVWALPVCVPECVLPHQPQCLLGPHTEPAPVSKLSDSLWALRCVPWEVLTEVLLKSNTRALCDMSDSGSPFLEPSHQSEHL